LLVAFLCSENKKGENKFMIESAGIFYPTKITLRPL